MKARKSLLSLISVVLVSVSISASWNVVSEEFDRMKNRPQVFTALGLSLLREVANLRTNFSFVSVIEIAFTTNYGFLVPKNYLLEFSNRIDNSSANFLDLGVPLQVTHLKTNALSVLIEKPKGWNTEHQRNCFGFATY